MKKTLLKISVLASVVFLGWFVYKVAKKTDKSLSSVTNNIDSVSGSANGLMHSLANWLDSKTRIQNVVKEGVAQAAVQSSGTVENAAVLDNSLIDAK